MCALVIHYAGTQGVLQIEVFVYCRRSSNGYYWFLTWNMLMCVRLIKNIHNLV